jgi:hypothetical protein
MATVPFHIFLPVALPPGYTLDSAGAAIQYDGSVNYLIRTAPPSRSIIVSEVPDNNSNPLFSSPSQKRARGWSIKPTPIHSAPGYVGTYHPVKSSTLTLIAFSLNGVQLELSSFDTVDVNTLIDIADSMK